MGLCLARRRRLAHLAPVSIGLASQREPGVGRRGRRGRRGWSWCAPYGEQAEERDELDMQKRRRPRSPKFTRRGALLPYSVASFPTMYMPAEAINPNPTKHRPVQVELDPCVNATFRASSKPPSFPCLHGSVRSEWELDRTLSPNHRPELPRNDLDARTMVDRSPQEGQSGTPR